MKKFSLVLLACLACLLISCGDGGTKTPGTVAKNFYKDIIKGDCVKAMNEGFDLNFEDSELKENEADIQAFCDKITSAYADKRDIKDVVVIKEEINEQEKSAEVYLKFIYGDGTESEDSIPLVLNDKGEWKITIGL